MQLCVQYSHTPILPPPLLCHLVCSAYMYGLIGELDASLVPAEWRKKAKRALAKQRGATSTPGHKKQKRQQEQQGKEQGKEEHDGQDGTGVAGDHEQETLCRLCGMLEFVCVCAWVCVCVCV